MHKHPILRVMCKMESGNVNFLLSGQSYHRARYLRTRSAQQTPGGGGEEGRKRDQLFKLLKTLMIQIGVF